MHAYSQRGDRSRALAVVAFASVVLAILANALFTRLRLGPPWLVSPPTVMAAYGVLYTALDRFAWHWSAIRTLGLVTTPIVEGRYTGRLVSSFKPTERPISIEIDQAWSRLIVRFLVTEPLSSQSVSLTASLDETGTRKARLTYTYRNTVRPGVADQDMNDHDGTAELTIDADTGVASGRYYNYRGRQGTLEATKQS